VKERGSDSVRKEECTQGTQTPPKPPKTYHDRKDSHEIRYSSLSYPATYGERRDNFINIYPNAPAHLRGEADLQHLLVARVKDIILLICHEAVIAVDRANLNALSVLEELVLRLDHRGGSGSYL